MKSLDSPDESRLFENGVIDIVQVGGISVGRTKYQPGWRWSESVKPIVKTDSCQVEHKGYVVSGRIHVAMDDGTEVDLGSGDAYHISPGHDAWVIGDRPWVAVDFSEAMRDFARPSQEDVPRIRAQTRASEVHVQAEDLRQDDVQDDGHDRSQ